MPANFSGNFGTFTLPEGRDVPKRVQGNNQQNETWPGYPFLYRLLTTAATGRVDEGDGLNGLKSTAFHKNLNRGNIPYWDVLEHVAFNPEISPFISATPQREMLISKAMKAAAFLEKPLYIVKIDGEQIRWEIISMFVFGAIT